MDTLRPRARIRSKPTNLRHQSRRELMLIKYARDVIAWGISERNAG